ncbi:7a-methyl-1,5-dioxo-octahydro-1H-inden-4-yl [Seminavis robusta]|uniref:7a-methyl-1,5-dioxo-octahydro-1H-inden-4-yl n=1 Tax=Seminavis robusta TaxID=568900 RepID=A0A9N8EG77_9STRA|nr:7a-methyl-1,5-dioxo-octahydro-1H-inden-4-yl [Seminavis robusta]|eukprot:Sro1033_g233690.1 7a-methyl-1,5-dioxo-octahydro-1H-inden-4-yl (1668) ;mRNA; f:15321-20324
MLPCSARTAIHETDESVPLSSPLVSSCEHLLQPNGSILGSEVAHAILPKFPSLVSAMPTVRLNQSTATNATAALKSIDRKAPISARRIHDFIVHEVGPALHHMKIGKGNRVALVLPNGPELAVAILAVSNWASCVPLNANGAHDELESDLKACAARLVIGVTDSPDGHNSIANIAYKVGIPFCGLTPSPVEAGIFQLTPPDMRKLATATNNNHRALHREGMNSLIDMGGTTTDPDGLKQQFQPNAHEDEILVLFTSGTTGQKKLVPHKLGDVLIATACISVSWKLTPSDVNCNLMPLFHVGGIIRQVFSPILSGGCVICCPSFDPSLFWSLLVQQKAFTWYYAAPTMHQLILETGKRKGHIVKKQNSSITSTAPPLRMIANAAGGLLPSLARELRDVFKANVLPSYGMTECMPISSPPAAYQLEKPGTSGVAVGPELAILNKNTGQALPFGTEGPICVRGEPCFRGYGINHLVSDNPSCSFMAGGWFDTGDLGYMDADGYLYITGRSKEVINRGGEIISPLEVEEAVGSHPSVKACAAFSAPHNVLQEVVGIVVVPVADKPKVDLQALHDFLGAGRLAAPKWPQCLVYMDALPKSHTNKLLRVKLCQRMAIPELNDDMFPIERTFSAKCPPQGTAVKVAIPCERLSVHPADVQAKLRSAMEFCGSAQLVAVRHPSRIETIVLYVHNLDRKKVVSVAQEQLDCYTVPSHVCLLSEPISNENDLPPPKPSDAIAAILQESSGAVSAPEDPLTAQVQELFRDLLDLDCVPAPGTNFFNLGGSSMLASQLASKIRKNFRIPFGGAEVFHNASCKAIANAIRTRRGDPNGSSHYSTVTNESAPAADSSASSSLYPERRVDTQGASFKSARLEPHTGFLRTLFQLVPICIVFPIWQLSRFFLFFMSLLYALKKVPSDNNLVAFVVTLVLFHFAWVAITPLIFVAIKWAVIGRYKEGRYAIWSNYYLRWWFVDVVRKLFGKGIYGSSEEMVAFYYRLLGAKIGEGARISAQADIAEFDLVTVGQHACVEYSTIRPFGVDNGCMVLGQVVVGNHSSVGVRSVVAPFTCIPDSFHLGPVTSSYEVGSSNSTNHARYNRRCIPEPTILSKTLIGGPITFLVDTFSHIPAALVLYWMVSMPWHHDEPFATVGDLMEWLCDVRRIPFYIGIRVARAILAPLFYMAAAIVVKWTIIGKFEPGPRDVTSEWQLLRHWLAATLFSRENMCDVTELIGRHYELVSVLYRLLGAKVGKRVFWPGHLPLFTGEFDLLEIGDDVVFGSRAVIICTTADSCEKVTLCAGANVSDNTVVLPGSTIGKNAVLGSNSICPMGRYLPESSIWLGSRGGDPVMLERGVDLDHDGVVMTSEMKPEQLQMDGDDTTIRPFGKAIYEREANYYVYPVSSIIVYTLIAKTLIATVHTLPLLGSLHMTAVLFYGYPASERQYDDLFYSPGTLFLTLLGFFIIGHLVRLFIWVGVELGAKWGFMGRRQEGRYNYDTSDYCQNWELYQIAARIRNPGRMNFMDFLAGTPFLVTFFRMAGCMIGKDCCLYPAGADPFMSEPDLVFMGDRCVIDCASVVCHLNTRGNFELTKITLGNHVTLRTGSRIQQGVQMESGSMLLEKSLAMTGEVIEANSVWQGAPASVLFTYDFTSLQPAVSFGIRNCATVGEPIPLMLRKTHSV